jgi:alkylated DNA repair dioxygenase AlkB
METSIKPAVHYDQHYVQSSYSIYEQLRNEVNWENREAPRAECFMADRPEPLSYTYGVGAGQRTYTSIEMHPTVLGIMKMLNAEFYSKYNICFLNYYESEKQHLGWHADDSPSQDTNHPIAVVSFGADRFIYIKEKSYKGEIPESDRYLLSDGSLFIMPAKMQENYFHKIPKGDKPCGGRISLTFRKYIF